MFIAQDRVTNLGHIINNKGLHPVKKKVDTIHKALEAENVSELQAFSGLLCYYNKFYLTYLLSWCHSMNYGSFTVYNSHSLLQLKSEGKLIILSIICPLLHGHGRPYRCRSCMAKEKCHFTQTDINSSERYIVSLCNRCCTT